MLFSAATAAVAVVVRFSLHLKYIYKNFARHETLKLNMEKMAALQFGRNFKKPPPNANANEMREQLHHARMVIPYWKWYFDTEIPLDLLMLGDIFMNNMFVTVCCCPCCCCCCVSLRVAPICGILFTLACEWHFVAFDRIRLKLRVSLNEIDELMDFRSIRFESMSFLFLDKLFTKKNIFAFFSKGIRKNDQSWPQLEWTSTDSHRL